MVNDTIKEEASLKNPIKVRNTLGTHRQRNNKGFKSLTIFNSQVPSIEKEHYSHIEESSYSEQSESENSRLRTPNNIEKSIIRDFKTIFSEDIDIDDGGKVKILEFIINKGQN